MTVPEAWRRWWDHGSHCSVCHISIHTEPGECQVSRKLLMQWQNHVDKKKS